MLVDSGLIESDQHEPSHPWWIKLQKDGQRKNFSTKKVNKSEAAVVAREIAKFLNENGMAATWEKYGEQKPVAVLSPTPAPAPITVGQLIKETGSVFLGRARTFSDYALSLRRIIGDIMGIERQGNAGQGKNRTKWLGAVDAVALADITRQQVEQWRVDYIKRAGADPVKKEAAETSSNTLLRQAKSLFNTELLEKTKPNAFLKVRLLKGNDHRFKPTVKAADLLASAAIELADDPESFKVVLLTLTLGLRRGEAHRLEWDAVNFEAGTLHVGKTAYLNPKSPKSIGTLEIEEPVLELLRGFKAKATGNFVLESDVAPKLDARFGHYRCQKTFERLSAWLAKAGIKSHSPIHELRKLFGSEVNNRFGIHSASLALRHADIAITSKHYVSKREGITAGLGGVLAASDKVIPIKPVISSGTKKKSVTA
jgi:integrase